MANLNLRKNLTQALSFTQLDGNFEFLEDLNTSLETRVSAEEALSASVDASLETVITDNKTTSDAAEASLDTRLDNFSADFATDIELSEAVSVETARAIAAEGVIEDNLSTELVDRAAADSTLQGNIDGVSTDLSDYEASNDAALSTEVADRASADTQLQNNIDGVAGDLTQEISDREADVDAEETRAIAAEGSIASDLADYETSNDAALSTEVADRIADVDAEQLRAETAEGVIEDNLSTELVDRASADTVLEGKIVTEETARISGDASLATRIDNLNNDFATDIEVSEAVSVETARAIAAEGSIASDLSDYETSNDAALSTELVARASADTVLQGNIDAEETRALAAEGVIEDNLSTELVDRAAADVVLQGNIDAEETRAIAAEGSIASDLSDYETSNDAALSTEVADRIADVDAEETRALAAEGVIEDNLSTELVARASADVVLQGNIDAEETRALAAEGVIADNLSTELVDRAAADNDLSTDITAEETARISGDASLTTRIDNLNNDFATDIEVSEAVSVETARAIAAEGVIEDNLSTELVVRASADVVLQDNIDAVAGDLSDYETSNDAALSTELVARASADTVLQGNIDDVEYLAENPRYIFDGNKLDITGASYVVVGSAEAIMVVDAPAVTNGNIDFTAATAGTISTIVIADLAGDSTGSSEFIVRFNQLFGNPYGTAELILQEGESAQVYMLSTGVGVLLAVNKAVAYVTEYPADGK